MHSREVIAEIERQYVFGVYKNGRVRYPTLKELSAKYEIPYNTLKSYSSKFGWEAKRNSCAPDALLEQSEQVKEAVENRNISEDIEKAANLGIHACTELLSQLQLSIQNGENVRNNTSLIRTLSEALKNFASVKATVNKPNETKGDMQYVVEFSGLKDDSKAGN